MCGVCCIRRRTEVRDPWPEVGSGDRADLWAEIGTSGSNFDEKWCFRHGFLWRPHNRFRNNNPRRKHRFSSKPEPRVPISGQRPSDPGSRFQTCHARPLDRGGPEQTPGRTQPLWFGNPWRPGGGRVDRLFSSRDVFLNPLLRSACRCRVMACHKNHEGVAGSKPQHTPAEYTWSRDMHSYCM